MAEGWSDYRPNPFWDRALEVALIGAFVIGLVCTSYSLGYFMGAELCKPETADSMEELDRELNLPLVRDVDPLGGGRGNTF